MDSKLILVMLEELELKSVSKSEVIYFTLKYSRSPDSLWQNVARKMATPYQDQMKLSLMYWTWWKRNTHNFQKIVIFFEYFYENRSFIR